MVRGLRDELQDRLSEVTPEAPDWETYRAWHLLAHLRSRQDNSPLESFSQEVMATRKIREIMADRDDSDLIEDAKKASTILHSRDLDARSLSEDNSLNKNPEIFRGLLGLILMALASPISIPSTGIQTVLAWYLGNNSDEGIDARTTHHMFAVFFSPVTFWPLFALLLSYYSLEGMIVETTLSSVIFGGLIIMIAIQLSNMFMLTGYDFWTDYTASRRRINLAKTEEGIEFIELIQNITPKLVALK